MTISSPEREAKKVKIAVDRNPVETSFEKWACGLKEGFDNYEIFQKNSLDALKSIRFPDSHSRIRFPVF